MKRILLFCAVICMLSVFCLKTSAQEEVNSLSEIAKLSEGTKVKVNLNNIHTSAYNYDAWNRIGVLYMQDENSGVQFKGMADIQGGKTLNGTIIAVTEKVNDAMSLAVSNETNTDNVTQTSWDFSGTPVTTIASINKAEHNYMLVTLENVISMPASSSYAVTLSDGKNTIDLYNDWDRIQLSKVPEKIKSITALVVPDVWNGGCYLIPISQDLIKDADAPDDATLIKNFESLSDVADGEEVLVNLNSAYTTATLNDGVFIEDATAGTVFYGLNITVGKVLNGSIYATAKKVGTDICLTVNKEKTNLDNVTVKDGTMKASSVYLNGTRSSYWHNRLVVLSDLKSEKTGEAWKLIQDEIEMPMADAFGVLTDYSVPEYINSLTAIVLYDAASDAYIIAPTDKDLIVEGTAPVEPAGIAKVKTLAHEESFELLVENAQVTYAEAGEDGMFYIIEDENGGLMLQQYPDFGWAPGDRVTGAIYGSITRERANDYYTDVAAVPNAETLESQDFEIKHGELTPTLLTCAEAKDSRYYSCYVKIDNVHKTTGTMTFMGYDCEYTAVNDGTATILFDDGWEVLPESWQDFYGICQLPDDTKCISGIIEPMFNRDFIYPLSLSDVTGTAGISQVESSKLKDESSSCYNLAGQRISKLQKGLNIVNGKKYILK